jgi:hypothetical protein
MTTARTAISVNARLCLQCKVEFADDCAGHTARRKFCSHSCYDEWDRIHGERRANAKRPRDTWMPDLHFESWGECFALVQNGRACEFRSCRHHLGSVPVDDAQPEPTMTDAEGDEEPSKPDAPVATEPSNAAKTMCTLIYAYHNPVTLASIARVLSVTRERVRQIEAKGLLKMKRGKRSDKHGS